VLIVKDNEPLTLLAGNCLDGNLVSQLLDLSALPSNMGGDSSTRRNRL
jgi:hypothetical protein